MVIWRLAVFPILAVCTSASSIAGEDRSLEIDCVEVTNSASALSTTEMTKLLSEFADAWNPPTSFSIAASGSMGRVFSGAGRAIHPSEMADIVSNMSDFTKEKAETEGVWLGVSDSGLNDKNAYAGQLAKLLNVKVNGCDADVYFLNNGEIICGGTPKYRGPFPFGVGRSMPSSFTMNSTVANFCGKKGTAVNPQTMVSAAAAFGLYDDEIEKLSQTAVKDRDAAFRLYQYYWISKRDRNEAIIWLRRSADLGSEVAQYNLAYELFEMGSPDDLEQASMIAGKLVAKGFRGADLRKIYGGN